MPKTYEATLKGYKRLAVKGASYPGIIPASEQDSVKGLLYYVETQKDMERLDWFESSEYKRTIVAIEILDESGNLKIVKANTYVWIEGEDNLEKYDWDFEKFLATKEKDFVSEHTQEP
ncbi:hypothetical protein HK098_005720 [Nowakowskiella sp. JEL0407]|nr:hypothetical protein HK098_005720 [Nowakowskiella sp. JEL0407]